MDINKLNPVKFVKNIKKPLFLIGGTKDKIVPIN